MSFKDIIKYDRPKLKDMVFIIISELGQNQKYFKVKINQIIGDNNDEIMISVIDVSD